MAKSSKLHAHRPTGDPAGEALRSALEREFPEHFAEWLAVPVQRGWLPPERQRARRRVLAGWDASPSAWFDWLRMRMTVVDLGKLIDNSPRSSKELGYLASICATGLLPLPGQLSCLSNDGLAYARYDCCRDYPAHRRAMACTLFLICDKDAWDNGLLSIGVLLQSCLALDTEGRLRAESFVAWLVECANDFWEYDCSSVALRIALLLLRAMTAPDDPRLEVLAEELLVDAEDGDKVLAFVESLEEGYQCVPPWTDVLLRCLSVPAFSPSVERLLDKLVSVWPKVVTP
jgi:hypothetical protein